MKKNSKEGGDFLRSFLVFVIVLALTFFLCVSSFSSDLERENFLFDRTSSAFGKKFFTEFSSVWVFPKSVKGISLIVSDRYDPTRGTQIFIKINGGFNCREVFRANVSPRKSNLSTLAIQAKNVVSRSIFSFIFGDSDTDDLSGNGF